MSFNKAKALKTASKYVQQGKYQSAIEEYRQIAQADPSDVTILNTLGDLYVKAGQTREAIHSFMHIAEHYRLSGFYLKAIAMLKKVSKIDVGNIVVTLKLAELYVQQKLIVDARHQYLSVAEHYIREGQATEALEIYQKIADLDPENTAVQIKLAEAYLREDIKDKAYDTFVLAAAEMCRQGKENDGLQTYLRAVKANPKGQAALSALVNLYLERSEIAQAIELIEGLLADHPNEAEFLTLLARIYQAANQFEAAENAINKALAISPARYQYALDLASAYVHQNDLNSALRLLDRITETLTSYREEEKATNLLREVLALDPRNLGALTRIAAVYERTHEDHLLIETLNVLADSALQADNKPMAISALKRLIELEPDETQYRRRLAQLGGEEIPQAEEPTSFGNYQSVETTAPNNYSNYWNEPEPDRGTEFSIQVEESSDFGAPGNPPGESGWDDSPTVTIAQESSTFEFSAEPAADEISYYAPPPAEPASSPSFAADDSIQTSKAEPSAMRDELESVDFYLNQGMLDIARYTLESVAAQFPDHPYVKAKLAQLSAAEARTMQDGWQSNEPSEVVEALPTDSSSQEHTPIEFAGTPAIESGFIIAPEPAAPQEYPQVTIYPVSQPPQFESEPSTYSSAEFFERPSLTGHGLPETVATAQTAASSFDLFDGEEMGGLLDFLDEFKVETEQQEPDADFDTHYNLGLAYKEMDMFEEAIEEFQQAFKIIMSDQGHTEYISCCSMLAYCFSQKNLPRLAVTWLKKGLESPSRSEDVYQALRYDLADAYAAMGELNDAYNMFAEVYAIDVQYRSVKNRMQEISSLLGK